MYAGRPSAFADGNAFGGLAGGGMRQPTPNRQPLGPLDRNTFGGQATNGYGLSGSAKFGRSSNGGGGQFNRQGYGQSHGGSAQQHVLHR